MYGPRVLRGQFLAEALELLGGEDVETDEQRLQVIVHACRRQLLLALGYPTYGQPPVQDRVIRLALVRGHAGCWVQRIAGRRSGRNIE